VELLSAITGFLKSLMSFVPRRKLIPSTHRGVKFCIGSFWRRILSPILFWTHWHKSWEPHTIQLSPGIHWWWPLYSQIEILPINRQVLKLEEHDVYTIDDKPIKFRGTVSYTIKGIIAAMVKSWEVEDLIDDEAEAAFCSYLSSKKWCELTSRPRDEVNDELTPVVAEQLKVYGVNVIRAKISTLTTGIPIMLIGTASASYTTE
jgi:regulator of protease activity HflC (stomatin/prohibitin superfamily)